MLTVTADQRNFNAYMCFGTITLLDDPLRLILPLAVVAEALYGGSSSDAWRSVYV